MDGGEERGGMFGISGGDTAPTLEMQESIFNQVSEFIQVTVESALHLAILLGRNHDLHARCIRQIDDRIGVISTIRKQRFSIDALNQSASMCAIRSGTCCDKYSDRHTMRIHGQMYLGIEPPLVRLIS